MSPDALDIILIISATYVALIVILLVVTGIVLAYDHYFGDPK